MSLLVTDLSVASVGTSMRNIIRYWKSEMNTSIDQILMSFFCFIWLLKIKKLYYQERSNWFFLIVRNGEGNSQWLSLHRTLCDSE